MRRKWKHWLPVGILIGTLLIPSMGVHASTFNVVISSGSLTGSSATLAFDFIDGGSPTNTVILSTLTYSADGMQGNASITGDVMDTPPGSGTGPWTFSDLGNTSGFNELLVDFTKMATSLAFSFTTTDFPRDPGSSADDSFSFFVLDFLTGAPLITTVDPDDADALFVFSSGHGLQLNPLDQVGFSLEVTQPQGVPEPGSLALLVAAFSAMFARRRFI